MKKFLIIGATEAVREYLKTKRMDDNTRLFLLELYTVLGELLKTDKKLSDMKRQQDKEK